MISDIALAGLTKSMDALKGSIESAFSFAQRAEKSSLALGMSFGQASDQLGGQMRGLRGDLNERFAGAIAGLEAGLQGNTAGIGRLINQQRLTGTASAQTAAAFAKMEMTMGLSREATNKLASDMVEMGAEFQISTDNLVGAINMMAESFPAQKLAGMGAEVNAAVAGLQAELGPAMSGPLNNVMKMIMDTSMEGYENLTKLGIGGVREQLAAAKSQEEAQMILKNAIATASDNFKSVVGDASQGYYKVGVAADTFGKSAIHLTTIQDAFGQRVKVEGEQTADFGNQLSVMKDEILLPLQEAFLEFFPIIKEVAAIFMEFGKGVISDLVEKVKAFAETFGPTDDAIGGLKEALEEFRPKVVEFFTSIGEKIGTLKVVLGVLAVAALAPLITVFMAMKAAVMGIVTFFGITFSPVIAAVTLAIAGVVAIVTVLHKKFGILDPLIAAVSNAFIETKNAIGKMLIGIAEKLDFIPGAGKLKEFGEGLQSSIDATNEAVTTTRMATRQEVIEYNKKKIAEAEAEREKIAKERKETGDPQHGRIRDEIARKSIELRLKVLEKIENQTDAEYEAEQRKREKDRKQDEKLAEIKEATKDTAKQTKEINEKTVGEIKTQALFLDETANMLGRSIEGILGIGQDDTMARIADGIETQNALTEQQTNELKGVGGAIETGS
jgi:hypothetical protein